MSNGHQDLKSRPLITLLVVTAAFIVVYVMATVVLTVLFGGTAAAIAFSLLAVLIGVAALTFSKLARRS